MNKIKRLSINTQNVKRKRRQIRSRKNRSGGSEFVKSFLTERYTKPTNIAFDLAKLIDTPRAACSLIRNVNQAYRFYIHCRDNVLQHLPSGDLKTLFGGSVKELGDLLSSIFHSSFLSKYAAVLRGAVTSDDSIKRDLRMFEENLKRYNLAVPNPSLMSKIYNVSSKLFNGSMIIAWGDWYRYELNILTTNLLALIAEISVSGRARTVAIVPDIIDIDGRMIPGAHIPRSRGRGIKEKTQ